MNLQIVNQKPTLRWIDLIGDLHRLTDQVLTADELTEFMAVAELGHPTSMCALGRVYFFGKGVPANPEKGRFWLDRAAEKGSLDAQMLLGAAYMSGTILPEDQSRAAKYLTFAAQPKDAYGSSQSSQQKALAQYWLALMYEHGRGVDKSHDRAIHLLELSANNGNGPAQFDLAVLYNAGGVTADKTRACALFQKAADQGHVRAMHNTGLCCQSGSGARKDSDVAAKYYTRAAVSGVVESQKNLGILFGQLGQGRPCYFWLRIAESSEDATVKATLDTVRAQLLPQQVAAAEEDVSRWLATHQKTRNRQSHVSPNSS